MKTKLLLSTLLSFVFYLLSSQVPQGFNYQAIARDGSGNILPNQALPVRISIMSDSIGTIVFWKELHASISSNSFGLITLSVGRGVRQTGCTVSTFSAIDWSVTPIFIKTEIYYSGGWITMGVSRLWSVPYAITAKNVTSPLKVTGTTSEMDSALFEVKNKSGQTVFAVYSEGIRAYVGNGNSKGARGGFAVGGYDATKGTIYDLFVLNTDSARFYVDSNPHLKGARGGFSVGGYDMSKGTFTDYLNVTKDSVRVYVDSNPATKGARGGFAVGGYDMTKAGLTFQKFLAVNPDSTRIFTSDPISGFSVGNIESGVATSYLRLTPNNYFIGFQSGLHTVVAGDAGKYNSFLGYQCGHDNVNGKRNVFLGYQAGYKNNADYNVFVGNQSGYANMTGALNVFVGHQAGTSNTGGSNNTFVGFSAGSVNTDGYNNVFVGNLSGSNSTSGNNNTIIGTGAASSQTGGSTNVIIGSSAAPDLITGSGNVYIGYGAGGGTYNISNTLYIANNTSHNLIVGTFGATDATSSVNVGGNLYMKGAIVLTSDRRLKTDLVPMTGILNKVLSLNTYYFFWNRDEDYSKGMSTKRQIGLMAQDVEKIFPELVEQDMNNYKALDYSKLGPILLEALKEQNSIIENQKTELEKLTNEVDLLKSQVSVLLKINQ